MKQFWKDKVEADKVEEKVKQMLIKKFDSIEFNHDNKYDLVCTKGDKVTTFEIKCDSTCQRTGNIGVEFFNRGKDSGINVSIADYYIFHIPFGTKSKTIQIKTTELKMLISQNKYTRIVNCGDGMLAKCYIFPLEVMLKKSTILA